MKKIKFFIFVLSFLLIKNVWSQDTVVLRPGPEGKDAQIHTILPDNNYENTEVFKCMAWTHSGVPGTNRALIAFDLSFISPGSTVLQAKFNLYFATFEPTYVTHTGQNVSYLQRITEPWEEDEVTWNSQPLTTMEDQVILPQSTDPEQDYTDIDVTNLVQLMVNEPENNNGLMLRLITEQYYRCLMFASGDCLDTNNRPKLEIIYIGCTPPSADFDYQVNGDSVGFTGISPTAINWHWDFGDGDTSTIQNPGHIYQQAGIYQVCLTVEDTCYFAEHCETIDLCDMPPVTGFAYTIDFLTVSFQDTSIMATGYYWDFGDGSSSDLSNPVHTYEFPGNYTVCLTASNNCGAGTACEPMDLCVPPQTYFTYSVSDLTVFFEDNSIFAAEYFWDFGDGYFSSESNPIHTYASPGYYTACLMTSNSCGTDIACEMIDFCVPPVTNFTFEIEDLTVFFEDNSEMADEYFWDFGDGYYSDLINPWHMYDYHGDYMVCLETWNECGYDYTCEMVYLNTVSISENDAGLCMIYPNPARDEVFIKGAMTGEVTLSLHDLSGKEVIIKNLDLKDDEIIGLAIGNIEPGLYIVRLDSGKNQTFGKLMVVK